ncbi:MAG: hypothetical protein DHS20C20_23300 [Ardenticatenaceae bacterium]|nr:MAG: hypothetical protein DHS20C20_23300 [Ardenticatenaceae bacterium]
MSTESMKQAARNWIENGFNQKNLDTFDAYFSPDLVNHGLPPTLPPDLEGTKLFAGAFINAFPDIQVTIEDLVAENSQLVARWSATGRHNGELLGIPPTGKQVIMTGIALDRFENGKSVEHWEIVDQLGLMQQLGVVPSE